jgi:hypothetical protein
MPTARYLWVQEQLQKPGVRRQLRVAANRKARAARVLAAQDDYVDMPVMQSDGTRPRGRPYSRVAIPASAEFGDSKTRRLRLLARVVNL